MIQKYLRNKDLCVGQLSTRTHSKEWMKGSIPTDGWDFPDQESAK